MLVCHFLSHQRKVTIMVTIMVTTTMTGYYNDANHKAVGCLCASLSFLGVSTRGSM
jgi:hypothetical protein